MTGFVIAEILRDVGSMNIFSTLSGAHLVTGTVRPCGGCFLQGRLSHRQSFSVTLPRTMPLHSRGLPSPLLVTRCSQQWASPVFLVRDLHLVARPEPF